MKLTDAEIKKIKFDRINAAYSLVQAITLGMYNTTSTNVSFNVMQDHILKLRKSNLRFLEALDELEYQLKAFYQGNGVDE